MREFRYALRSLARSPGFVLVATACLGLALALNTTTFAMLDAMLHPTLPVEDKERLFEVRPWGRGAGGDAPMSERLSVLRQGKFYEELALYSLTSLETIRAGNDVNEAWVPRVSRNLYGMLGVRPEIGRLIGPGDPDNVAVVSHDVWERSLGGRSLEDLTVWIGVQEYRVIGVLPAEMTFPPGYLAGYSEGGIWAPLPQGAEQTGGGPGTRAVVKLRRRVEWNDIKAELAMLANRLTMEYGSGPVPYAFSLHPIIPDPLELRQIHFALAGAALVVLLIACVNLANLMLVRGVVRRRELALRMALGAERATVVRHLMVDAALVAVLGAALGLVLTLWAIGVLRNQIPPSVVGFGRVYPHVSWRVFSTGLGLAGLTLLVFGLWPALRASDVDVSEPLKESTGTTTGRHHRYSPLVVVEVALSLVLLMGAALLSKAASRIGATLLGYDRAGLLDARVWIGPQSAGGSVEDVARTVRARVAALPEVRSAATYRGLGAGSAALSRAYDGANGLLPRTVLSRVGEGFLATLGIPVLQGRDFVPGDDVNGAVIVDQVAANALWPDGRAVGRLVKLGGPDSKGPWHMVVGLARAASVRGPAGDPFLPSQGAIYLASRPEGRWFALAIRTTGLDSRGEVALRHAIRDALPPSGWAWVDPWLAGFDAGQRARRFLVRVFGSFSAFALVLAAIGLYGVVSYSVSQRMREFAVRAAVGSSPRDVVSLVAHDAAVMVLAGTGIGAFLAMWASTLLGDWLYTVYHTDAASLVIAESLLILVGVAACLQPALRAMRANPVEILRAI